jgi:hypothetical protein
MVDAKPMATSLLGAAARCGLLGTAFLLFTGCDLTSQNITQGGAGSGKTAGGIPDPLVTSALPGAGTALPPNRSAATIAQPQATGGVATLPPIPPPSSTTSTAVLTGGGVQGNLVPDGRDLRIATGTPATGALTPGDVAKLPDPWEHPGRAASSGVALTGATGNADAVQSLLDELKKRSVAWVKMEMQADTNQWKFSCAIASVKNPNYRSLIEARAATLPEAMRLAIDKIDNPDTAGPSSSPGVRTP